MGLAGISGVKLTKPTALVRGVQVYSGLLGRDAQISMREEIRSVVAQAPLFTPKVPSGRPMSVRMTSAGKYGWYSDRAGYRYEAQHPNGTAWPGIPASVLAVWHHLVSKDRDPDCCLINYYDEEAKMGMHQDRDEHDFSWPVLSISLGDDARFRIGNVERGGKTESFWLHSGDVVVMGGEARLVHHGIDRLRFQSSTLLRDGGRINLTLRVVD